MFLASADDACSMQNMQTNPALWLHYLWCRLQLQYSTISEEFQNQTSDIHRLTAQDLPENNRKRPELMLLPSSGILRFPASCQWGTMVSPSDPSPLLGWARGSESRCQRCHRWHRGVDHNSRGHRRRARLFRSLSDS